jgi:hydroxymethylbilane synthase
VTSPGPLRIGTRRSRLAHAQAEIGRRALKVAIGLDAEIVEMSTVGDVISARRPSGRWENTDGQFTGALEDALLAGAIDVAVHSLKDLPTAPRGGLSIAAVLARGDARDCLLTRHPGGLAGLPFGASIGTSSPRRAAQLAVARPDLTARPIRGNVDTRLRRLRAGEYDGLLLAAVGLDRLGISIEDADRLPLDLMLPAPGQGALVLQVRDADEELKEQLGAVDHWATRIAVDAERDLLRAIGGGCLAPLGAYAVVDDDQLRLQAAYEHRSGEYARIEVLGRAEEPSHVVGEAAAQLLAASPVAT